MVWEEPGTKSWRYCSELQVTVERIVLGSLGWIRNEMKPKQADS